MGTSVGTSGTVGVALILIAKTGGVNIPAAAGAIIAGAYFGDRCSPMSSSANLVAFVTGTEIYDNVKNMFRSCVVPLAISAVFYFVVSGIYPLKADSAFISSEILNTFNVSAAVLIPVAIIIVFSLLRISVKYSIICSIIAAAVLGIFLQHLTLAQIVHYIIYGYSMDKRLPLYSIIKGGGMVSMVNTSIILFIASALAGVIEETRMLEYIEELTVKAESRFEIFRNVFITSIFTSAIGCCQAFTIILTNVLNEKAYEKLSIDKSIRALDLENTSVLVSALIPWNLSLVLPMAVLNADYSCLPYLIYIYIFPLWSLLYCFAKGRSSFARELSSQQGRP
jgi:NhaC family Na+:H+ antiporter